MKEKWWRGKHGEETMEENKWRSHHGGEMMEGKSWRRNHGGGRRNNRGKTVEKKQWRASGGKHQGSTQENSRGHSGDPEAPERHPETHRRQPGDQIGTVR